MKRSSIFRIDGWAFGRRNHRLLLLRQRVERTSRQLILSGSITHLIALPVYYVCLFVSSLHSLENEDRIFETSIINVNLRCCKILSVHRKKYAHQHSQLQSLRNLAIFYFRCYSGNSSSHASLSILSRTSKFSPDLRVSVPYLRVLVSLTDRDYVLTGWKSWSPVQSHLSHYPE